MVLWGPMGSRDRIPSQGVLLSVTTTLTVGRISLSSAVPMAARVVNKVGQEYNKTNYLLMHAMGPNVAGVLGSAVAAGVLLALAG